MSKLVEEIVAQIENLDLEGLRRFWKQRYGPPPSLRSEPIMRQLFAWRVQVDAFGGFDEATRKALSRTGRVQTEGKHLGVGARLSRVWKSREMTVVVEEQGFSWEGQLFPSLSSAATAIAGARWNGPGFFGLRDSR